MERKYRLNKEDFIILPSGKKLFRIISTKDFADVKVGDAGGYVESERNLSQLEHCWIYDNAKVFAQAAIFNDAQIRDNAEVSNTVVIANNAVVCGNSKISGKIIISDYSRVQDNVIISNSTEVLTAVFGNSQIKDNVRLIDILYVSNAVLSGDSIYTDSAKILGNGTNKIKVINL